MSTRKSRKPHTKGSFVNHGVFVGVVLSSMEKAFHAVGWVSIVLTRYDESAVFMIIRIAIGHFR